MKKNFNFAQYQNHKVDIPDELAIPSRVGTYFMTYNGKKITELVPLWAQVHKNQVNNINEDYLNKLSTLYNRIYNFDVEFSSDFFDLLNPKDINENVDNDCKYNGYGAFYALNLGLTLDFDKLEKKVIELERIKKVIDNYEFQSDKFKTKKRELNYKDLKNQYKTLTTNLTKDLINDNYLAFMLSIPVNYYVNNFDLIVAMSEKSNNQINYTDVINNLKKDTNKLTSDLISRFKEIENATKNGLEINHQQVVNIRDAIHVYPKTTAINEIDKYKYISKNAFYEIYDNSTKGMKDLLTQDVNSLKYEPKNNTNDDIPSM